MDLSEDIRCKLIENGAAIVGFADLTGLPNTVRKNFDYGISIGLSYSRKAIEENRAGKPEQYYHECTKMNETLPILAKYTASFLIEKGYPSSPQIQYELFEDDDHRTVLPYKTVATRAGIGWIGKCATLVTKEFGSAVRLVTVLTSAPLRCGTPIDASLCPEGCTACKDACPGQAVSGRLWHKNLDRAEFFDAFACRPAARKRAKELLNIEETICGLCIASCPFTIAGLNLH